METSLFIHGFTGGEFEISPLAGYLQENKHATKTFTLKGYSGDQKRSVLKSTRQEWIKNAEDELVKLLKHHQQVNLIGFSAGALIAVHLSLKYTKRIKTLTLLSTPVFPLNPSEIMKTLLSVTKLKNYLKKFISTPLRAAREFRTMVNESFDLYGKVDTPTLIIQGKCDHLVKTNSASHLYVNIGAPRKKLLLIEKAGHLICHSKNNKIVFAEVYQFIKQSHK